MKKLVSFLLALVLVLSSVSALAAYNDHTDYVDWPIVKDGEKLTVSVATKRSEQYGKDPDQQWFWIWSETYSGIDFEVDQILSTAVDERKSLMFASGDLPDLLFGINLDTSELVRYGMGEGMLLDLTPYMIPVYGLYDVVEVEHAAQTSFRSSGLTVDCSDADNLCMKAVRLMQACYGAGDVSVALDKRIPFGAGLGGGSSDATAVILALDELFRLKLPERELIDCAAALGSDTAFFVRNTPQLCTGRGEVMTPVKLDLRGLWIAVVKPDCGVSTREAYAGIRPGVPAVPLAERIARPVTEWQTFLKNDFEPHIFAAHPEIAAAKAALLDAGAVYAAMSGSGSAVFGLFDDEEKARSRSLTPFVFPLQ